MDSSLKQLWILAEEDRTLRISAALKLCESTKSDEEVCYVVERLVNGLSSSRKAARLGFASALSYFVQKISVESYLTTINKFLQFSSDVKSEKSSVALGRLLAYLVLVNYKDLSDISSESLQSIASHVVTFGRQKSYLHLPMVQCLLHFADKVPSEQFTEIFIPKILVELSVLKKEAANIDMVYLLFKLLDKKCLSNEETTDLWRSKKFVSSETMDQIRNTIMNAIPLFPVIHPFVPYVAHKLAKHPKYLSKFWSSFVDQTLCGPNFNASHQFLAIILAHHVLSSSDDADVMKTIFSKSFMSCVAKSLQLGRSTLHEAAQKYFADALVKKCETTPSVQAAVFEALCEQSSGLPAMFGLCSKVASICDRTVVSSVCSNLANQLLANVSTEPDGDTSEEPKSAELTRNLCTLVCDLLPFGNSLDNRVEWSVEIIHNILLAILPGGRSVRQIFDEPEIVVFRILDKIKSQFSGVDGARCFGDTLQQVVACMTESQLGVYFGEKKRNEAVQEFLSAALKALNRLRKVWSSAEAGSVSERRALAFSVGLSFLVLRIYLCAASRQLSYVDLGEDCLECARRAAKDERKRRKSQSAPTADADELPWSAVVVDLLLSLLSEPVHANRTVANVVLGLVASDIDADAVRLILESLSSETALEFSDDEPVDADAACNSDHRSDDEKSDNSDGSENSDNAQNDRELASQIDAIMRQQGKKDIDEAGEGEDSDAADFTDEQMFALDDALAQVFRERLQPKGGDAITADRERQALHFRLKVLDLIGVLMGAEPAVSLLVSLCQPLLALHNEALTNSKQQALSDKCKRLLGRLPAAAAACRLDAAEPDDVVAISRTFSECLKLLPSAASGQLAATVSQVLAFLAALLGRLRRIEPLAEVAGRVWAECQSLFASSLSDFLHDRNTHLREALFEQVFARQPAFAAACADELVEALGGGVRVYVKTQALLLAGKLFDAKSAVAEATDMNDLAQRLGAACRALLQQLDVDNVKVLLVQNLLALATKIEHVQRGLVVDDAVRQRLNALVVGKKVNRSIKSVARKLCGAAAAGDKSPATAAKRKSPATAAKRKSPADQLKTQRKRPKHSSVVTQL